MRRQYPQSSITEIKELLEIIEPYAHRWKEWTQSGASFLSPKEIIIIQNFFQTGSHHLSSSMLNLQLPVLHYILQLIKQKLKQKPVLFNAWLTEKLLEEKGIITYTSEMDRFLHSPIIFLAIDYELRSCLSRICNKTMYALLSDHTLEAITNNWFMNQLLIDELKQTLERNQCLHLLREY